MFNPMLGHMSGAYAARVSPDLSLCSRFDFNVYSYESEWSLGAELWTRRHKPHRKSEIPVVPDLSSPSSPLLVIPVTPADPVRQPSPTDDITGVVKARASTTAVCGRLSNCVYMVYLPMLMIGYIPHVGRTNTEPPR